VIFGPDLVVEAEEKVRQIQANLKAAQSRQANYANKRRRPLSFNKGDMVYISVSPVKGVKRFGVRGKLAPRYVGPYPIVDVCGPVAYRVELPSHLSRVHSVFHVSQLKKCLKAPIDVAIQEAIPLQEDLTYAEYPVEILDTKARVTRNRRVMFYKILWSHHTPEEATWESEEFLRRNFPDFVRPTAGNSPTSPKSRDEIFF
jgi:hypothetical protein